MNERMMEIVYYIVDAMQSNVPETIQHQFETLSQKLIEEGYTETEIDSAISWLVEKMPTKIEGDSIIETTSHQQLNNTWYNFDKPTLTPAAFNFLIQLKELDIIGDAEIEQIVAQAVMYGKKSISISEIKAIVDSLIFNIDDFRNNSFFITNHAFQVH
jgi:uncharacterized protein Smg (DUF494 family)